MTSQPLGSLPPGFAATKWGYLVYADLVGLLGLIALAVVYANPWFIIGSITVFVVGTIVAIRGEVVTYRKLKR